MKKFDLLRYSFFGYSTVVFIVTALYYRYVRRLPFVIRLALVTVGAGFMVLVDMYLVEPNWIEVNTVTVQDEQLANRLRGIKVVQISDLHLKDRLGFREKRLVKMLNELRPDILCITGDIIDDVGVLRDTIQLLNDIKVTAGIYAVLGNTDHHFFRTKALVNELQSTGVTILLNENKDVTLPNGQHIRFAGVDDPVTGRAKLERALTNIPTGEPVLLLAHSQDIYAQSVLAGVNLLLVGHTHGGQVGIDFLLRKSDYANRYMNMAGVVKAGETTMYINRGIGTKTLPIRFFCRPEITVLRFVGGSGS